MTLSAQENLGLMPFVGTSHLDRLASYGLAMAMAVLLFFSIYPDPIAFLSGNGVYFEIGDTPQHVSGWLFFAKDAWRWPLLTTQMIAPPQGSHVALSDSIPLAALLFKPLYPLLWENFHYLGLWHLVAKVLQALGAVFLVRSLGARSLLAGFAAAGIALLWPAMLFRLQHTALTTHGVLLFALGFYFRSLAQAWSMPRLCVSFALLLLAALLIHPYLFAMVFAVFLAAGWDRWALTGHWLKTVAALGIVTLAVAVPALLLGYAGAAGSGGSVGYEFYAMNLLSPFCGGALSLCGLPDATGGQYEGFNYFGLGGMLLLVAGLIMALRQIDLVRAWLGRHIGLVVILLGLTAYALSGSIYLGTSQLTDFSYPFPFDLVSGVFRASGRFFWIVGYALVFLSLAALLRQGQPAWLFVIPLALVLQWQDTERLRQDTANLLTTARPFDYSGWSSLDDRIDRIALSPSHGCDETIENMRYVYFQIVAARLGVPINTAYQARSAADCAADGNVIEASEPGVLRVDVRSSPDVTTDKAVMALIDQGTCWRWEAWNGIVLCLDGSKPHDWAFLDSED